MSVQAHVFGSPNPIPTTTTDLTQAQVLAIATSGADGDEFIASDTGQHDFWLRPDGIPVWPTGPNPADAWEGAGDLTIAAPA